MADGTYCLSDSAPLLAELFADLHAQAREWGYWDDYAWASIDPSGTIECLPRGDWLWIRARVRGEGSSHDRTTDVGGDPYYLSEAYDWVGRAATVPMSLTSDALKSWALIRTAYARENVDVGCWGTHAGERIEAIDEDGTLTWSQVRVARIRDVAPQQLLDETRLQLSELEAFDPGRALAELEALLVPGSQKPAAAFRFGTKSLRMAGLLASPPSMQLADLTERFGRLCTARRRFRLASLAYARSANVLRALLPPSAPAAT